MLMWLCVCVCVCVRARVCVCTGTMANPGASAQLADLYLSRGVSALAYVEGKHFAGGSFRDANREHGGGLKGASWRSQVVAIR